MSELGPENSIKFLKQLGLDHLDEKSDSGLALVLGGLTNGATPLEMAGAYATIANGGEYITPTFYTKLVDSQGKTVLQPKQEKRRVMSEGTAYITKSILKAPVTGSEGTATNCKISGMDVGAKTGTTDDNYDRWLCGITPYYAAATWFGFDKSEYISYSGNPSAKIWAAIMQDIHKNLPSKTFDKPSNIVTAKICKDSGKSATSSCSNTYTEEFVSGTVPSACDGHAKLKICKESGKLANEYCTNVEEKTVLQQPEKEKNGKWKTSAGSKYSTITEVCDIHKEPENNNITNEIDTPDVDDQLDIKKVKVPNVVGKTESEAKSILLAAKLRCKIATGKDKTKEAGIVLKQSRKTGEEVKEDTIITITINEKSNDDDNNNNNNTLQNVVNTVE